MGTAKTPEKQREYYLAWKAKKPESYVKAYKKRNTKTCSWNHISMVFRKILIDDFEPKKKASGA